MCYQIKLDHSDKGLIGRLGVVVEGRKGDKVDDEEECLELMLFSID